jgi:hypothetical protein
MTSCLPETDKKDKKAVASRLECEIAAAFVTCRFLNSKRDLSFSRCATSLGLCREKQRKLRGAAARVAADLPEGHVGHP